MKKLIKIILITLFIIILLVIALPFVFKGKVIELAKIEMNKTLNANVEFADLKLSMIKGFPNLFVAINNLTIVGIDDFDKDTLISFDEFSLKVNLLSAIKKEIKIKSILLNHPVIHALKTDYGKVNWDIVKESEEDESEEVDTTMSEPLNMKVALKRFEIKDAYIYYLDDSSNISSEVKDLDFVLSGNLAEDFTSLLINTSINAINVKMDGINYLKNAKMDSKIDLDADIKNGIYTIKDNSINFNELGIVLTGSISLPDTQNIDVDIKFITNQTEFKSILSMVPAVYMVDFEDVETEGSIKLEGYFKGRYNEKSMPSSEIELLVDNARFNYPDLPKSAENINIDVDLFFDGEDNDMSKVDINKFHVELANNPIDIKMKIRTPISDPDIEASIIGTIDLSTLSDVIPLEDMSVRGFVYSNIQFAGKMSMIENEKYQDCVAEGKFELRNIQYSSSDLPEELKIQNFLMIFSPKYVNLNTCDISIGKSNMHFSGKAENFIPYVFSDGTVHGNFIFSSSLLDLNEFLPDEEVVSESETIEDTVELSTIEIPENVDFILKSSLDKVIYDKLNITNIIGKIHLIDKKAILNLKMNLLQGSMNMNNVEYNTQNKNKPSVHFNLNINKIDIPSAFKSLSMVQQLVPMAENTNGKASFNLDFNALMDNNMSPVLNSIDGYGDISTKNILIKESKTLNKIGEAIKTDKFKNLALEDVNAKFEIKDGRVFLTEPVVSKFEGSEFKMTGSQGIDQTMDYKLDFTIPRSELGAEADHAINSLTEQAAKNGLNIPNNENLFIQSKIGGTFTDPIIKINLKENVNSIVEDVKEQVKEKAKEEVKKIVDDTKQKVSAEAQRIINNAENESQKIKEIAKISADKVRSEADIQYDNAVKEANKVPKIVRTPLIEAAKKIKSKAYSKAIGIEKEADDNSNNIISVAKKEAANL